MNKLRVYGTCLRGNGYPNANQTINILKNSGWDVQNNAYWMPESVHLWRLASGPINKRLILLITLFYMSFRQSLKVVLDLNKNVHVYVPYPSVFTLWWLSWVPKKYRPFCISDAYISIWDSMFRDRSNNNKYSLLSRLVKMFEGRALRAADLVLSDTEANVSQLQKDFNIKRCKLKSLPLAIDESELIKIKPRFIIKKNIRVLFIGTMIPLHGIDVILDAIRLLKNKENIEFRLVGSGQFESKIIDLIDDVGLEKISWISVWQDNQSLATEISEADICLGVFGGESKAARVLPFKIYMALAAGRPVITQNLYSQPDSNVVIPLRFIDAKAEALAKEILTLAGDILLRNNLGRLSQETYKQSFSNSVVLRHWECFIKIKK